MAGFAVGERIDCDLERRPAVTYAADDGQLKLLQEEYEVAKAVGLPVRWSDDDGGLPYPVAGAIWLDDQGGHDFLPPLRPAAAFWALFPPLPEPLLFLLWLLPLLFPPRLEDPGEFEIAAARDLLIPFFRKPSYCLSFFTLEP